MNNQKRIIYVVITRDVCEPDVYGSDAVINDCAVLDTRENARAHLQKIVENYKTDGIYQRIEDEQVGYDVDTDNDYVLLETPDSFSYYEQGNYNDNHIEIRILERVVNPQESTEWTGAEAYE